MPALITEGAYTLEVLRGINRFHPVTHRQFELGIRNAATEEIVFRLGDGDANHRLAYRILRRLNTGSDDW